MRSLKSKGKDSNQGINTSITYGKHSIRDETMEHRQGEDVSPWEFRTPNTCSATMAKRRLSPSGSVQASAEATRQETLSKNLKPPDVTSGPP